MVKHEQIGHISELNTLVIIDKCEVILEICKFQKHLEAISITFTTIAVVELFLLILPKLGPFQYVFEAKTLKYPQKMHSLTFRRNF